MKKWLYVMCAVGVWGCAQAQVAAPTQRVTNVVNLSATAVEQVTQDWLTLVLTVTREAPEASTVQRELQKILEPALAQARREASPGEVEVRTGRFQVSPRYGRDGRITGWQGTAELVLAGRNVGKVATLAGRLNGLVVGQAGYSLSRELREQREAALAAAAIQKFRARAQAVATEFGFRSYALGEISLNAGEATERPPTVYAMRAKTAMADEAAAVPTEPGQGELSASVQGSVQLLP